MRKLRAKYIGPGHPWESERMEEEASLLKEFGLKNKKEIWRARSLLKNFAYQAKKLIAATGPQAEREKSQLFGRLQKLGIISQEAKLDDILGLGLKDILERRLQTIVFRKGLARSVTQARQFITHAHIIVGKKKLKSPAYLVSVEEMPSVGFSQTSGLAKEEHPERIAKEKAPKPEAIKEEKDEEKPKAKEEKAEKEAKK